MKLYLSLLVTIIIFNFSAQGETSISYLQLHIATSDIVKSDKIRIGVVAESNRGYERRTRGLLRGVISWKSIKVTTEPPMEVDNGMLLLDHKAISENNGVVIFTVSVKRKGKWFQSTFKKSFATLQKVELDNTIIEAYKHSAIQVRGCFSNGREYMVNKDVRLPGLSVEQFDIEAPDYVRANNGGLLYSPDYSVYFKQVPICVKYKNLDWSETYLDVNYDVQVLYNAEGKNGQDGHDGYAGHSASRAGYSPSRGTDGTSGTAGTEPSTIYVYQKKMEDVYLTWLIHEGNQMQYIFSNNARLNIVTSGGDGGDGGNGGRGGSGADGTAEYEETFGASGGDGGNAGDGANGGDVHVYYNKYEDLNKNLVQVNSVPGNAGKAGVKGKGGYPGTAYVADDEESSLFSILAGAVLLATKNSGSFSGKAGSNGKKGSVAYYSMDDEERQLIDNAFWVGSVEQ
jgi:hypothetical protein